jgi:L-threonylcarbamoyladenylate synthase
VRVLNVHRATRIISIETDNSDPALIREAADILRAGGLVAFATETVYGLGADATNPEAVAKIYEAKGRPALNPLIVHAAGVEMAEACVVADLRVERRGDVASLASALAADYWPGPLTLVLPRSGMIPDIVTAGLPTVGVRVPRPLIARQLIAELGRPVAAPSANRSTGVSPTLAWHVLKDLDGRIDLILDSGQTDVGLESTVVDLTTREPRILRPGPVTAAMIERSLGGLRVHTAGHRESVSPEAPTSPGQLAVHYAPTTPTVRVETAGDLARFRWPDKAVLLVVGEHDLPPLPAGITRYVLKTPERAAHELYIVLRQCDWMDAHAIVVVPPPDRPEWAAIRDRLARAARPWEKDG